MVVEADYREEIQENERRAALLVDRNGRDIAIKLFQHAANELTCGRFKGPKEALEFVSDAIL